MKRLGFGIACVAMTGAASAQLYNVVPNGYENTAGNSTFLFMVTTGRTYQLLINENQLTNLVGMEINGLTWRLPVSSTAAWPPVDAVFNNFDVYVGPGVAPANRSTTFADNYTSTPTQVRSGSLTMPAGSFPTTGTPREWGFEVTFDNYMYTGGHLTIEARHSGMTGNTTTRSFDANSATTSGYLVDYAALWVGSYTPTTGGQGNFFITRLSAVPEPGTVLAITAGLALLAARRRKR